MSLDELAELLVPHRGAMLLAGRLVEAGSGMGRLEACLPGDSIVAGEDGRIAPLAFVELVAQCVAALNGHAAREAGLPTPSGMLVGVQSFEALGPASAGETLSVIVSTVGEFGGFTVVDGEVRSPFGLVARGRIKLFVPPGDMGQDHVGA